MLLFTVVNGQLNEKFDDGDFTNDPVWVGDNADFIVNTSNQLQSNSTTANSTFFLVTPSRIATTAQWDFYVKLSFNPSSVNYVDIYLTASDSDLTSTGTTGYFVRVGNTDDEISLYRKDAGGISTKLIDGTNGVLNNTSNVMKIKVVRDTSNRWTLQRDLGGTGNSYISEGSVTDETYNTSFFLGFLIKQSTSSFFQKHYFDDIEIKKYLLDTIPPKIQFVNVISPTAVDLLFNEPVSSVSSQATSNYFVNNNIGNPVTSATDPLNSSLVHLNFAKSLTNAVTYTLTVDGVKDISGNAIVNSSVDFNFHTTQIYDVVIDEIMADPTPQVGLPNSEWIELKNISAFPIDLQGWKISDLSAQSGPMPDFILKPDSFVIVCASSATSALSVFGHVISVTSFPSLDDNADLISLHSSQKKVVHAVEYSSSWYQNELKKAGGWTLEMIDTKNPCSGFNNWKASANTRGGTPGNKNSIDGINIDDMAPKLLRAFASDATTLTLVFDEPLDSLNASVANNYLISNGISVIQASVVSPVFKTVNILLNSPIALGTIYTIAASGVTDCKGNLISSQNTARFGLAQDVDNMDIVINEILYNPRPGGVDYVEIYNRSKKIIDLNNVYIANRNSSNVISSIQRITAEHILLFPGDFMVVTSDVSAVNAQYITTNPAAFIPVSTMPSFADNAGDVILLNKQGAIIDEVIYSDKWQFPLIANTEGISLERIDYDGQSAQSNFHSAATSVGYGTPGYKNSQYRLNEVGNAEIKVSPDIFSPDNDGVDDFATIDYMFPRPGFVANITIFDASGTPVRYLERNALCGLTGYYRWDGLDDKSKKLPQGIYIIYTEIFNTAGKMKRFKNTIVLARRY